MAARIDAGTLKAGLSDGREIALLDVREHGQHAEGHPFLAVPLPYSRFELDLPALVPNAGVRLVLCDGGDGVAERAAARAEALGYADVRILDGGVDGWRAAGYTLYAGVNVPSKAFGELLEQHRHTPHVTAAELKAMQDAGEDVAILDGRTFAEFQRMSIPGGVSCPNGELAVRVAQLVPRPSTRIVVNCAGRTRSIVGAQTLIDLGIPNPVCALENGTQGWFLAGLDLDHGARRHYGEVAPASGRELAAVRARARALAEAAGVGFAGAGEVAAWLGDRSRTTYLLDVRSPEEFAAGSVAGFVHAPGGQLVQATDQWIGTRGARVVLADAEEVRAPMTARWLRQLGHAAYVLAEGLAAAAPLAGLRPPVAGGWQPLPAIPAGELRARLDEGSVRLVDLRPSMAYRRAHIAGAAWSIRPRLAGAAQAPDVRRAGAAPAPGSGAIVLVADDPGVAALAARDLAETGARDIRVLGGGEGAARAAGLALEATPDTPGDADCIDFVFFTHGRHDGNAEAARRYLAWELGLLAQLDAQERAVFAVQG